MLVMGKINGHKIDISVFEHIIEAIEKVGGSTNNEIQYMTICYNMRSDGIMQFQPISWFGEKSIIRPYCKSITIFYHI